MIFATRSISSKLRSELGWSPARTFEEGLFSTVAWYIENRAWWNSCWPVIKPESAVVLIGLPKQCGLASAAGGDE